jgi:metallo-beta-lactamase family protein
VFLVHGETTSMQALADALNEEDYKVIIPEKSISINLA